MQRGKDAKKEENILKSAIDRAYREWELPPTGVGTPSHRVVLIPILIERIGSGNSLPQGCSYTNSDWTYREWELPLTGVGTPSHNHKLYEV